MNGFQNKSHEFDQGHSRTLIELIQMENTKTTRLFNNFLKAVEFCPTFDIQIDINLAIFWERLQNHTL